MTAEGVTKYRSACYPTAMPITFTRDDMRQAIEEGIATVGDHTYGHPSLRFPRDGQRLTIGRYSSIGTDVCIYMSGNHNPARVTTYPFAAFPRQWRPADQQG